jgi:3-dehydroquinate dehydratase-2
MLTILLVLFGSLLCASTLSPDPEEPVGQSGQSAGLRILVVHGPNLNLLGRREPVIYGVITLDQINESLKQLAMELNVELMIVQSNHEGVLIDTFQKHMDDVDGAIINPAGYGHHSVALHDVIKAMPFPVIETHLSNLGTRDEIHRGSVITPVVKGTIRGLGWRSYTAGLRALVEIVREENDKAGATKK